MKRFVISEEEKNKILNMHKSATSNFYLNEELEKKESKTDADTNPYWKQLSPKLKALGFTSKKERHKFKPGFINIGGYPEIDFVQETLTKGKIKIEYPFAALDYNGDYYPDYVEIQIGFKPLEIDNNPSCIGLVSKTEDWKRLKVNCVDYIEKVAKQLVRKIK